MMIFSDGIVTCSERRKQSEESLERWRYVLERRGMRVSCSKTEHIYVKEREANRTVRLQEE